MTTTHVREPHLNGRGEPSQSWQAGPLTGEARALHQALYKMAWHEPKGVTGMWMGEYVGGSCWLRLAEAGFIEWRDGRWHVTPF